MSLLRERRVANLTAAQLIAEASGRGGRSTAGQVVTPTTSMQLMAVWRCQHLLADIVAGLPLHQFRERPDGSHERVPKSDFVARPSNYVDDHEWRYQLMLSALGVGNSYGYITEFDPGFRFAAKAEVLAPGDVSVWRRGSLDSPRYRVNGKEVDPARIMHMRAFGPTPGSVLGLAPLEYMRQTVGLGLAVKNYGATWYEFGGHPTGLLTNDNEIDATDAEIAKERFRDATSNDHLAVIGKGWKYDALQVTPEAALFLAGTNATAVDICGYYGVPAEMLGYAVTGPGVTYANREQRALDLLVWTVQWWVGRVERLISLQTPTPDFVKINVDAILRSDLMTRYKSYDIGVRGGWLKRKEPRQLEDLDPLPSEEGEMTLWPPGATAPPDPDDRPPATTGGAK